MVKRIRLVFLGAVAVERQPCLGEMAVALDARRFVLPLDTMGWWRRPQILWMGPSRTPRLLRELVSGLQRGIGKCGLVPDARPYEAHVTLARKARRAPSQDPPVRIDWRIDRFVLVESVQGPAGPRYSIVGEWPLG